MTTPHREFTCVHPLHLSLARFGRMVRPLLGQYPRLRTPPLPVTHAGIGNGRWTLARWQPFLCHTHVVRPRVAPVTPGRFRGNARPISMLSYASVRACQCGEAYSHSSKRAVTVASEVPRSGLGRHDGGANATVALPTCHRVGEPLTIRSWYAVQWVMKELRRTLSTRL